MQFQTISEDSEYVLHEEPVRERLRSFDANTQSLFAFSPTEVVAYEIAAEGEFFETLLRGADRDRVDSFLRLSMATATSIEDLVFRELVECARKIALGCPPFLHSWYTGIRRDLEAAQPSPDRLPENPTALLELDAQSFPVAARETLLPLQVAGRRLEASIRDLRNVVARKNSNGAVGQLGSLLEGIAGVRAEVLVTGSSPSLSWRLFECLLDSPDVSHALAPERASIQNLPLRAGWLTATPLSQLGLDLLYAPTPESADDAWGTVDVVAYVQDETAPPSSELTDAASTADRSAFIIVHGRTAREIRAAEKMPVNLATVDVDWNLVGGESKQHAGRYIQVISGVAKVEEAIAEASAERAIRPALRRIGRRSLEIGSAHADRLQQTAFANESEHTVLTQRVSELRESLSRQRAAIGFIGDQMHNTHRTDIPTLRAEARQLVIDRISHWQMTAESDATLSHEVSTLIRECSGALDELINHFVDKVTRSLRSLLAGLGASTEYPDVRVTPEISGSVDYQLPKVTILTPQSGLEKGTIAAALVATLLPPFASTVLGAWLGRRARRLQAETSIRDLLLNGNGGDPGLLRQTDQAIDLVDEQLTRAFAEIRELLARNSRVGEEVLQQDLRRSLQARENESASLADALRDTAICLRKLEEIVQTLS